MGYENLTPEQLKEAKTCTTREEFEAIAKKLGHELSEEELDAIAGGFIRYPNCSQKSDNCRSHCESDRLQ